MSDDLIRRSDAIKELHDIWREFYSHKEGEDMDTECFCGGILTASHAIEAIPTIEPKRGEWKVRGNPKRNLWECSLCRCTIYSESESDRNEFHKWCGRCGARMKGADDE